jgi:hypothetical protein
LVVMLAGAPSRAQEAAGDGPVAPSAPSTAVLEGALPQVDLDLQHSPDRALERYRTPLDKLVERAIGQASRRSRYAWREDRVQLGLYGGLPAELNNYETLRGGAFVRVPVGDILIGMEAGYARVRSSESAEKIALTPYRQPGRPSRFELDFNLAWPLAEGVVTLAPAFLPSAQLVLNLQGDLRYFIYPDGFTDMEPGQVLRALPRAALTQRERANLDAARLPGMALDPARVQALAGLGVDLYFGSGFFFAQRALVALPLFSVAAGSLMHFGLELDLAVGLSF